MASHVRAEAVSSVLYPDDATEHGRELRLQQEFFFVSATLQVSSIQGLCASCRGSGWPVRYTCESHIVRGQTRALSLQY